MRSIHKTTCDLTRGTGAWVLDPEQTKVTFRTQAMWVLPVKGTVKALGGDAQVSPDGAVNGTLIINSTSFTTKNKKRDDHLRSDAILAVVNYPHHRLHRERRVPGTNRRGRGYWRAYPSRGKQASDRARRSE